MTAYYFTRHGESRANVEHVFAGWTDSPLTEKGKQDARAEGERLVTNGTNFDLIMSSPLSRAHDTAKIIAQALGYSVEKIICADELKERNAGAYEGMPTSSLDGQLEDVDAIGEAGGETRSEFALRVQNAFKRIRTESIERTNVLIVAHAGWYKMAVSLLEHKDTNTFYVLPSPDNNKVVPFSL